MNPDKGIYWIMNFKQIIYYGLVVGLVIFFIGWITGLGGSLIPNIVFSVLMGFLAAITVRIFFKLIQK